MRELKVKSRLIPRVALLGKSRLQIQLARG
jgi:hypothetical protein